MSRPSNMHAAASDPNTPLTTLQHLAQNYPKLRVAVAANPSTYPALLQWLADLEDPAIDAALASRADADAAKHPPQTPDKESAEPEPTPRKPAHVAAPPTDSDEPESKSEPPTPVVPADSAAASDQATGVALGGAAAVGGVGAVLASSLPAKKPTLQASDTPPDNPHPEPKPATSPEEEPKKKKPMAVILLSILAVLLLAGLIGALVFAMQSRNTKAAPVPTVTQIKTVTPAVPPHETPTPQDATPPADAITPTPGSTNLPQFQSADKNIMCGVGPVSLYCTLNSALYSTNCENRPDARAIQVQLRTDGNLSSSCVAVNAGKAQTLEANKTTAAGSFACKALPNSAIECWNTQDGRGFYLGADQWYQWQATR